MASRKTAKSVPAQNRLLVFLLGILVLFAGGFVLSQLQSVFKPLFLAVFFSFIFDPMVRFFVRLRIPTFMAYLVSLIIVFWGVYLVGLVIYASFASLSEKIPFYQTQFNTLYQNLLGLLKIPHEQVMSYLEQIRFQDIWKQFSIPSLMRSTVGSFFGFVTNMFIILLFTVYITTGKNSFVSRIGRAFPERRSKQVYAIVHNIDLGMQKYLGAKTLISLITGLLSTIVLLVFKVEFALIWGFLTFILNFIPQIGSAVAVALPVLISIFQYGSMVPAVWIALLLLGIQMFMGNVAEPRLMGKSLHMSPLVVIFSLILWGTIWGIEGMLLAVPISASIQIVCANIESLRPIAVLMGSEGL